MIVRNTQSKVCIILNIDHCRDLFKKVYVSEEFKILTVTPQLVLYYACDERNQNGTCKRPIVRLDSRTREVHHQDIKNIHHFLDEVCVDRNDLDWKNLHCKINQYSLVHCT